MCASVCVRFCVCVCSRYPFGMCLSRCSRASCLPLIGAGDGASVVSAQQRTSTRSHVHRSALGGSGTRSDMRGHTHASHTAHPSTSRPSTGQSIEAFFHPSVRVTLALASRTVERARVHPYTHGNADTWAHALIRSCIMCVPEHKGACIYMSVPLNV